ncbi:hypothetical protein B0J13DRAFT_678819 [Dactylonectria estremocensis]|uniref:Uncharacterized protein n=1 Tax=Dactylonectria estremocensis TaxID=1079267 RepID=A0A9P9E038_9HYPO|nr:hypothetical protein B0J13DRAFT_678819 [Dactylonectria estremocensis]
MTQLIWLVTATTSGLGAALVEQLVARGDKVVATGRDVERRLAHLKSDNVAILELDVTAPRSVIDEQIQKAWEVWGRIDVLMNNAGVSAPKSIEEADDEFVSNIFNVNLFGTLRVTQSILPHFRAQRSGTIAFTGAGVGWGPLPFLSHYAASKAALDIFVEGLSKEVQPFNIRCVVFEPGGFASQLGSPREGSNEGFGKYQPAIASYTPQFNEVMTAFATEIGPNIPGDVKKLSQRIADCVKGEGLFADQPWAVRVILGSDALRLIQQKCKEQLQLSEQMEKHSLSTDQDGHDHVANLVMLRYTSILTDAGRN